MKIHVQLLFLFTFTLFPASLFSLDDSGSNEVIVNTERTTGFIDRVRAIGRRQAVGVRGRLLCGNEPVKNATVKLWDNDMFDPDDLLAEVRVSPDGTFEVFGSAISVTEIDPQLRIYHNCRSKSKECRRKITFTVPDNYINSGIEVTKWFELGTPNMEIGVKHKEEPHCI
uniref:Uncharacterized protein n=1 Tax=Caenorhabditis japonica TaxID=281687 RepID=A0A8R1DHV1_CAEJA